MTSERERRERVNARNRRYRKRKRQGLKVYQIELDGWHLKQLQDAGLVDTDLLNDPDNGPEHLAEAVEQLLAAALDGATINNSFWSDFDGPESMAP